MYYKSANSWLKHWDFILLDLVMLQMAYILAFGLRNGGRNPYADPVYLRTGIVLCLADICVVFFTEGYRGILRRGYFQEFKAVAFHAAAVICTMLAYLFLTQEGHAFSRLVFIYFTAFSVLLLYTGRISWRMYLLKHKRVYYSKRSVLVMTTSDRGSQVLDTILHNTYNELYIEGVVLLDRDDLVGQQIEGVEVVCTGKKILDYIQNRWIDSVMINVDKNTRLPEAFVRECLQMGLTVHQELDTMFDSVGSQRVERFGGYSVLSTAMRLASSRQIFFKRFMDLCGGIVGCILTAILCVVLGPAIYIASPGPIFFSQIRVGQNGRRFRIYKFRSMYMDAEQRKKELMDKNEMSQFMFKVEADPRIIGSGPDGTRRGLGWFIRKTSLDEFPQFWNVLKGDMSLVGTRPPTVDEWEKYDHHHRGRMAMKPGITGLWQVSGRNEITDFENVVRLDTEYIQTWSIGLDLRILFKTVWVVVRGVGAK